MKAKGARAAFERIQPHLHMHGGVQAQRRGSRLLRLALRAHRLDQCRQFVKSGGGFGAFACAFPCRTQTIGGKVATSCLGQKLALRRARPCRQFVQPAVVLCGRKFLTIPAPLVQPVAHLLGVRFPVRALRARLAALHTGRQRREHVRQRLRFQPGGLRQMGVLQRRQRLFQRVNVFPDRGKRGKARRIQRIDLLAPVIAHGFLPQCGLVVAKLVIKGLAAIQRVFAQHALTPGINRVHGGFIHRLGSQRQPPAGLLRGRLALRAVFVEQVGQESIVCRCFTFAAKHARRLRQAGADAVGQFAGSGAGEGEHQNLLRRKRQPALKRGIGRAVAENQPQIERGNRPGLAGTGAGFDETAAVQGKFKGIQHTVIHRPPPARKRFATSATAACRAPRQVP